MSTAIRIHTQVLPGHRIEVSAPQLEEGSAVDVLVVPSENWGGAKNSSRREMLRLPLEQRRQILSGQSERLGDYYQSEADRSEWQGGDILE